MSSLFASRGARACLLALLGTWAAARAQQPEPEGIGVWYTYFADYGISEKWAIHHETHLHLYEPLSAFNRFVVRAGANYKLQPALTGSLLYHYSYGDPTYAEAGVANRLQENRLMEQLLYRHKAGLWGFSHRLRTEQRFLHPDQGSYTTYRARYRLLASHPLVGPLYASADGEVLFQLHRRLDTSYRLTGSLGAWLNPHTRLQLGYTRFFFEGGRQDERLRVLLLFNPEVGKKKAQP